MCVCVCIIGCCFNPSQTPRARSKQWVEPAGGCYHECICAQPRCHLRHPVCVEGDSYRLCWSSLSTFHWSATRSRASPAPSQVPSAGPRVSDSLKSKLGILRSCCGLVCPPTAESFEDEAPSVPPGTAATRTAEGPHSTYSARNMVFLTDSVCVGVHILPATRLVLP